MSIFGRRSHNLPARLSALAAVCLVFAAAQPAQAEQAIGSPKWAAEQFKRMGLKPAPAARGFLSSVRIVGEPRQSALVVGLVPGSDPLLAKDYVLVTARLDAAGEAVLLEVARAVTGAAVHPRRSIVFVLSGAEGADRRAAAPSERIVADLDLDALSQPGQPEVTLRAADETSLGRDAAELAADAGLGATRVAADPQAYGARSLGIPTLSIGLVAEAAGADRFGAYVAALVSRVARRDERPVWSAGSRFAPPAPRAAEVLTDPVHMPLGRRPQAAIEAYG